MGVLVGTLKAKTLLHARCLVQKNKRRTGTAPPSAQAQQAGSVASSSSSQADASSAQDPQQGRTAPQVSSEATQTSTQLSQRELTPDQPAAASPQGPPEAPNQNNVRIFIAASVQELVQKVTAIDEKHGAEVAHRRRVIQALQDLEGQISMDEKLCGIAKQTLEKRTEDAEKKAENAERKTRIADKKAADAEKRAKQIVRDRDAMEEQLTALREKYRTVENVLDEQWDYDVLGQRLAESETRLTESEQRLTNSEKRHTDTRAWAEKQEQVVKTRQQATEAERLKAQHESTAQSERYHSLSSQFRDALFEKKCLEIAQSSAAITQPRLDQDLATARAEIKRLKEKAEKTEVVQQVGLHR
ncbi:hypothetical protein H2201_007119 [Coniosporium apollinis]|uniref:SWI5-dependent HO expression protein 3 n=1 Tax=Coniosporium apollinis TaxID=61459 RepID=A0ABQ9NKP7_9PEZI|nr:hypothetical protein H2201_007119 [Coniosporium apollinis]